MAEIARPTVARRPDTASRDGVLLGRACREYRHDGPKRKGPTRGPALPRSAQELRRVSAPASGGHSTTTSGSWPRGRFALSISGTLDSQVRGLALTIAQGMVPKRHRPRDGLSPFSVLPIHRGPRSVIHGWVRNPCCLIDGEVLFDSALGHERYLRLDRR